ncbi:20415_t:CDS:2 [Rhizophagus irregularis]|nr:20415_t:CDS:2 [Rhizophagus irregularis]
MKVYVFFYTSENNQRGIQEGKAYIISISADGNGPCTDIKYYLSKRPHLANDNFYLQSNPSWIGNVWHRTALVGINRLMSCIIECSGTFSSYKTWLADLHPE